jgi:hypothetical protein
MRLPRPVKKITIEFTIFRSRKAGIQVCKLKLTENKPPVNHKRPRLIARHSLPNMGVPKIDHLKTITTYNMKFKYITSHN